MVAAARLIIAPSTNVMSALAQMGRGFRLVSSGESPGTREAPLERQWRCLGYTQSRLVGIDRVGKELGDRHRTYAAGDRRNQARHRLRRLEINIACDYRFAIGALLVMDADINDNSTGLDPIARDEARLADGDDENICRPDHIRKILRAAVADGYRGVFLHEHEGDGLAYEI